ncbi:MAG TPA: M15 family metallopeptidase, partial [Anaerolineaceae bacterium]|nr:M15 family metallopeptidase [Anaerolineaceae bacterium]
MFDPTESHLSGLEPRTRLLATYLIIAARQSGIPLIITSSKRGFWEQARLVASGASKTLNSKHLRGQAFDVDVMGWSRDALPKTFWEAVGSYGEYLGLKWGGRWKTC